MGVPAADVDEAQGVVGLHQAADAPGRQLEALGRGGAAVGLLHLGDRLIDLVAHLEALRHGLLQRRALVHVHDQPGLAVVDTGLAHRGDADIGHLGAAAEGQGDLVGEGDRPHAMELAVEAAHEAGIEVAGPGEGLAQLDHVLRLEVAARQVPGAGEGHEGQLPLLPQGIEAVLQRGVQAEVGVQRQGGVGVLRVRARDLQGGAGLVVEVAGGGDHHIGGVVGAAQEHHQQAL